MARPKGFAAWTPRADAAVLVEKANTILNEYRSYGPMTARQIFYRLVGDHGYDKTEKAYKRLCNTLVLARRARMIKFGDIRDDGTVSQGGGYWTSVEQVFDSLKTTAENFNLDRMSNQPDAIEVWCEAAGMVPMLVNGVEEWDVPVYSTGGFSSVTVTHEVSARVARRWRDERKRTHFLHVGDWDPSGQSIYDSMAEDIQRFCDGYGAGLAWFPERVLLTEDQVVEHGIPTAPPKHTDTRSANWGDETAQAEAMPPDLLVSTVRDAVEQHIDADAITEIEEIETRGRQAMTRAFEDVEL